jgi:hypothetical protein
VAGYKQSYIVSYGMASLLLALLRSISRPRISPLCTKTDRAMTMLSLDIQQVLMENPPGHGPHHQPKRSICLPWLFTPLSLCKMTIVARIAVSQRENRTVKYDRRCPDSRPP